MPTYTIPSAPTTIDGAAIAGGNPVDAHLLRRIAQMQNHWHAKNCSMVCDAFFLGHDGADNPARPAGAGGTLTRGTAWPEGMLIAGAPTPRYLGPWMMPIRPGIQEVSVEVWGWINDTAPNVMAVGLETSRVKADDALRAPTLLTGTNTWERFNAGTYPVGGGGVELMRLWVQSVDLIEPPASDSGPLDTSKWTTGDARPPLAFGPVGQAIDISFVVGCWMAPVELAKATDGAWALALCVSNAQGAADIISGPVGFHAAADAARAASTIYLDSPLALPPDTSSTTNSDAGYVAFFACSIIAIGYVAIREVARTSYP